jgi:hypothetical protein
MKTKNIFIAFALTILTALAFAHDTATTHTHDTAALAISSAVSDSLQQVEATQIADAVLNTGISLLNATNNNIIPGMDNTIPGIVIGVVIREIIAAIFRRRKRKKEAQQ